MLCTLGVLFRMGECLGHTGYTVPSATLMMEFLPCSSEGHFLVLAHPCWAQGVLASSLPVFAGEDPEVWGWLSQNLERYRTAGESLLDPEAQYLPMSRLLALRTQGSLDRFWAGSILRHCTRTNTGV